MKQLTNLRRKSTLLLLTLVALFAGGVSPAWGDTLTETFDAVTVSSRYLLSNGWVMVHNGGNYQGFGGSYDYQIKSGNYDGETGKSLYCSYSDDNEYVVIPTKLFGTFTYYAKRADSSNGTVDFFEATKSEETFTVTATKLATTSTSSSWSLKSFDLGSDGKYVAIRLLKSRIDQISATVYEEVSGPAFAVKDGSTTITSPYAYSFGLATAGTTKTFTLSNPGTAAVEGLSVSETGSFGATLSATSIAAGGEATLTITMPSTTGNSAITISSTTGGIDDFVINASGTVRDENKLWCDFKEGVPEGWTNSGNWTIATSGADGTTSGGGYAYNTSYGSNKLMYTPLVTIAEGEKLYLQIKGYGSTASWNKLNIQYSADGTNWSNAKVLESITNEWQSLEVSEIPAGNWYIGFYGSYVYFTDIYGGTESTAPVIALSQNSYDFGLISANTTSEAITITNTGKSALNGLNITSNNANFTVNCEATEIAANGGTAAFTVTMAPNATGAQTATITVKSSNADALVFTATGAVAKEGTTTAIFNDATLAGWTKAGNTSFSSDETAAYFYYSTNTLTSPKVNIAADDFLAIEAKMASSYGYVTVQGSADGTSWTDIKKLDSSVLNQTDYTTAIVSGISTDYKFLRLNGYYCYVKQVAGLNYAAVLSVTQGTGAVTSPAAYAFGEVGTDQTVTYNFTNAGAGTIYITGVVSDNEVFTTNWTESVAADNYELNITANYDAAKAGEQNGTVTVTTTEGDFVINLTSTFLTANAPKMDFYIGEATEASTTGASLGFGIITADATKSIKIQNDGTGALNITNIALPDEDYITDLETAPTAEAPLVVAAGNSKTIVFTLKATGKTVKTGKTITISAEGMEDFSFSADAYVLKDCETVNFADGIPSTWTNGGWSVDATTNKDIYTNSYSKPYLTTPKMSFSANDFIIVNAKKYDNDNGDYIQIQYSTDNGANWTNLQKLDDSTLPTRDAGYSDIVVSNIPEGTNKLRFQGYYARIKTIAGLTYDDNDPKMGIYTDADCTVAATTTETKNFEFATETQTATYYIKNVGTGTMTLALGDQPAGFTQALDKTSVAAGEKATLTITMPAETKGYRNGTVTVNATDLGAFTVAVSGVMVDENKLNLDFTTANIPSTWTNTNWTKNDGGFIRAPYSYSGNATLESGTLTAEEGEEIVIIARSQSSSSSYTVGVNYKKVDAEEWSTLIAAANPGTTWTLLHAPIAEAGDYIFQFTGNYSDIQHIYGLTEPTEPVMVVYDGESVAAATYNFGNVANDADAEWTLTVKNEGKAVLEGLAAALSGEQAAHYSVNVTGLTDGNLAANATATITVKQLKDNLGAHTATLTISATSEGIADKVITLSGTTRDASKMYVDFADGIPATWTATGSWTTSSGYAQTPYSGNVTLTSPALTIAAGESLTVDLSQQYSRGGSLTFRYTTDGGINWNEQDLSSDLTYGSFTTKTLSLGNEKTVTAFIQFVGTYYARIDNIYGGTPTTAPLFALATSETLTDGKYDFGQALQAAPADKVFTITNNGNADLVSDIAANDDVTIALSGDDVTINGSQITVPAGKTATLTVSMKFDAANAGAKEGSVYIDSNDPVADVTLNFIANVLDATASNVDFANNAMPAGWYNSGFTTTNGYASNSYSTEQTIISELLVVSGADDVLSYDAYATSSWNVSNAALEVSYSTDRKNWTPVAPQPTLTASSQTFTVNGLKAGNYYLKFTGKYVNIDNITGWHKQETPAAHDLFFVSIDVPEGSYVPGSEYTATVKVVNLRAESESVAAELYIKNEKADKLTEQVIALNETKTFTLTGTVPEEGKHLAYVKVFNSDVTIETEPVTFESAHNHTLEITEFTRTSDATVTADDENKFTATFDVKVKNTGSADLTAKQVRVTVTDAEGNPYQSANATETLAVDAETTIAVTVTTFALEGGEFTFKVQEEVSGTTFATPQTVTVTAAAPKFALYQDTTPLNDGDDVQFGFVKTAQTFTFNIKNEGTKPMELVSIVAPESFETTAVTDDNKTIAEGGNLDINVTLKANQGKVAGNLVITYKVDATTNKTFTLALSGRSLKEGEWYEDFSAGSLPTGWTANNWTVGTYSSYENTTTMALAPSGSSAGTLVTPRLAAKAGDVLTWDAYFNWYDEAMTVEYSADEQQTWTKIYDAYKALSDFGSTRYTHKAMSFTAPANGNYYVRFTSTYSNGVDNLVGFELNMPDHIMAITASNIPTSGSYSPSMKATQSFEATVTVKESRGVEENGVVAKLYMGETVIGISDATDIEANESKQITIVCTPTVAATEGCQMHIEVEYAGGTLSTAAETRYVAEFVRLDMTENSEPSITTGYSAVYDLVTLDRSYVQGWNTIVLPVETALSEFGEGAKAYGFSAYEGNSLKFASKSPTLVAGTPYLLYLPNGLTKTLSWETPVIYSTSIGEDNIKTNKNDVTFQGTYAPIAAGGLTDNYGVTSVGEIRKAGSGASIKGFRAYFTGVPDGVSARIFVDGEATGILTVKDGKIQVESGEIYNLSGQKVNKAQKGMYIINGKKVVVK